MQVSSFVLGQLSVVISLLSPLDALSDVLFSAHMGQHEILMLVSAPLLVLGRPLYVMLWAFDLQGREALGRWSQGPRIKRVWQWATRPLGIVVWHGVVVWAWHLPVLYEAALAHEGVHIVQHATFFVTAALFWWSMIYGRFGRMGYGVAVLYVFLTAGHTGALGALATFARKTWYPTYVATAQQYATNALEDQQLAGLIMWIPAGFVLMILGLALFAAWVGESGRRVTLGRTDSMLQGQGATTGHPAEVCGVDARSRPGP